MNHLGKGPLNKYFTAVVFLLACQLSVAQDVIKVAASDFPPYTIINGEHITGIDIVLVNTIAKKLNYRIEYLPCPWKRCLKLMKQGKIDLLSGVYKRPEREEYMWFLQPHYVQATNSFYINKYNSLQINQYSDLKNISIGIERGTGVFEPFDSDASLNKHEVNKLSLAIKMTRLGRLDTFVGATIPTDYLLLKKNYHKDFKRAQLTITNEGTQGFITLSKRSRYHSKKNAFNEVLQGLKESGEIKRIIDLFSVGGDIPQYPIK